MAAQTLITEAQFDALSSDSHDRQELIDGERIELAQSTVHHQSLVSKLSFSLMSGPEVSGLAFVSTSNEFSCGEGNRLVPDVTVSQAECWSHVNLTLDVINVLPNIAVEILSPSESTIHVERKIGFYLESGVSEVWVIFPERARVYVHQFNSIQQFTADQTLTTELLSGWSLPLGPYFGTR